MSKQKAGQSQWHRKMAASTTKLALWTSAWVLSMALATFGPQFLWMENKSLTFAAILLNTLIGLGMVWSHIRHVKTLDELQRKIQLEAMGISLGVVLVLGMSYSNLDISNLISGDAEISVLVIIMGLTFITATRIGAKRYK